MSLPESEVGSTANSYAILAKLATGGMAELFLARNASAAGVERYVVLKRILRHRANNAAFVQMFLDEAKLAAQLQHPNIAQVYDTGVLGDSHFFTMEYVHGETVRDVIQRTRELGRAIPIGAALTIVAGAAAGLHHAHERRGLDGKPLGIVHRDVSPSNLMVSYEGNVKVVDFGVAKAAHRATETQAGTIKGKISYLSPEQCRGRPIDRRSDLFSLGIVLWELLVGDRLFKRGSDYENMEAIAYEAPAPPSRFRHEVQPDVEAIVMKLLANVPADRYQTAAEVLEDVEQVAVRAAIPLSSPSLGRLVRELFGQRLEPWVQMQKRDSAAEVTVTAAPVGDVDSLLASVPDLSSHPRVEYVGTEVGAVAPRRWRLHRVAAVVVAVVACACVLAVIMADDPSARSEPAIATPTPAAPRVPALEPGDAGVAADKPSPAAAVVDEEPSEPSLSAQSPAAKTKPAPQKSRRHRPRQPPERVPSKARNCDDDPLLCRR